MAELNRDGPLMEYGRRIAAGELLDGDSSQVCPSLILKDFMIDFCRCRVMYLVLFKTR